MKIRYSFLLLGSLILGSCSTNYYYCATMNTDDFGTVKNEYGEFLVESDSIDVNYSFYGQNAPITVGVNNKTSKPIYIDWSKSGIMIDDVPTPYVEPQEAAKNSNSNLVDFNYFLNNSNVVSYVKPYESFSTQILELSNFNFEDIDDADYESWYTEADSWGDNKKHTAIRYIDENSPIYLRTFLTIYEDSMYLQDAYYYEIDFYMSELIKLKSSSPKSIAAIKLQRGDSFYVKEKKAKKASKEKKDSPSIKQKLESVTGKIEQWAVEGSKISESN